MKKLWILVVGSPIGGWNFVGPFESQSDANSFADQEFSSEWVSLVALESPEAWS